MAGSSAGVTQSRFLWARIFTKEITIVPSVHANGIQIEYDTFGQTSSPPLLLIMGLGGQMILWDEAFCRELAGRDLYVIRFDNRDVGLSSKMEGRAQWDMKGMLAAAWRGEAINVPYTIDDMADDAMGLLDGLGLKKAHVCGSSMGGMIAQLMTIRYPERVISLISMASTTGNPELVTMDSEKTEFASTLPTPVPQEREANIEFQVKDMCELSGPGFPFDEEWARKIAAAAYDRCFYPQGAERQLLAVMTSGNRKPALKKVSVPTLVIHGDGDPMVPVKHGRDTADAVPGSDLLIMEGMGHDLPRGAWPPIVDAIAAHVRNAVGRP